MITEDSENLILTPPPDVSDHIDLAGFPEWFQELIRAVCRASLCPVPEFAILPALQAVGAVVGNSARVYYGSYKNPPMLWGAVIAPSGYGKSIPHEILMSPLLSMDVELNESYNRERAKYLSELEGKKKTGEKIYLERPRKKSLLIDDSTPEARAARLQDSPNGCLLYMDELAGLFQKMGQYSGTGGGEISDLIRYYGNNPVKVDRRNEDSNVNIPAPFLGIYGTLQPSLAKKIFANESLWDQGFAMRWLFVYVTEKPDHIVEDDVMMDPTIMKNWECFLFRLRKRYFGDDGKMRLSEDAKILFKQFRKWTNGFAVLDLPDNKISIYYKSHANLLRLALIIQIIKNEDATRISGETMRFAVNCMYYFLANSVRFYDDIFQKQTESSGPAKLTKKDVSLYLWNEGHRNALELATILRCDRQRIYQILKELSNEGKINLCKPGELPKISGSVKTGSK